MGVGRTASAVAVFAGWWLHRSTYTLLLVHCHTLLRRQCCGYIGNGEYRAGVFVWGFLVSVLLLGVSCCGTAAA